MGHLEFEWLPWVELLDWVQLERPMLDIRYWGNPLEVMDSCSFEIISTLFNPIDIYGTSIQNVYVAWSNCSLLANEISIGTFKLNMR
mmetsp:Transcript_128067/g.368945  ORF Transcript_128067/g.368945 Transcript_128067/m.368945 type:complete len:87 (+) Transcript_128067:371-631(+)